MKTQEEIVFKSNGWQTVNRLGLLNENYHTLILNYNELKNEIIKIQTCAKPILLLFNNLNLNRYIFNFLASTTTLIDSCITLKMIILWNTISTSNYNGTSITLEIPIGILKIYNKKYILFL